MVLCVCIAALMGCATGNKKYFYGLAFGPYNDGVKILDFQYGDEPHSLTNASTYGYGGGAPQKIIVWLNMPKSSLRVKWLDLVSKKEYEQIVDREKLPANIEGKQVWFEIKENVLQVYVVDSSKRHRPSMPDCGAYTYRYYECEQVFPGHTVNF
jgi:hypothetical protein